MTDRECNLVFQYQSQHVNLAQALGVIRVCPYFFNLKVEPRATRQLPCKETPIFLPCPPGANYYVGGVWLRLNRIGL